LSRFTFFNVFYFNLNVFLNIYGKRTWIFVRASKDNPFGNCGIIMFCLLFNFSNSSSTSEFLGTSSVVMSAYLNNLLTFDRAFKSGFALQCFCACLTMVTKCHQAFDLPSIIQNTALLIRHSSSVWQLCPKIFRFCSITVCTIVLDVSVHLLTSTFVVFGSKE